MGLGGKPIHIASCGAHSGRVALINCSTDEKGPGIELAGYKEFLKDPTLSGTASEEELGFLRALTFGTRHPTALYYYRELQNLRDPLHFRGR